MVTKTARTRQPTREMQRRCRRKRRAKMVRRLLYAAAVLLVAVAVAIVQMCIRDRTYNSTFSNFVDYRLGTTRDLSNSIDSAYSDKYGPVVGDGEYVEIVHSQSYKTRFIYDSTSNTYKMQQNYSDGQWRDTVDEAADNKVLTFPNRCV